MLMFPGIQSMRKWLYDWPMQSHIFYISVFFIMKNEGRPTKNCNIAKEDLIIQLNLVTFDVAIDLHIFEMTVNEASIVF